jgi:hypothetical protein
MYRRFDGPLEGAPMKIAVMVAGLVIVSALAWGRPAASQAKTSEAIPAEAVTLDELRGVVVETSVLRDQVIRRMGKQFKASFHGDLKISITLDDKIEGIWTPTSYSPRGVLKGKRDNISTKLEQARSNVVAGGGNAVWVFNDGKLINLWVYKGSGAAIRREIAFARTHEGFTCTATEGFARENGVGSIEFDSPFDGVRVTVVSEKQVSSTCRVAKQNSDRRRLKGKLP